MCYKGCDKKMQYRKMEQVFKSNLSSDWFLKLEIMKEESLVIANKNVAVNK